MPGFRTTFRKIYVTAGTWRTTIAAVSYGASAAQAMPLQLMHPVDPDLRVFNRWKA